MPTQTSSALLTPAAPKMAAVATSIVCGTNFSEHATEAVEVAAAWAQRLAEPLVLVHAVDEQSRGNLPRELRESLRLHAYEQMGDERKRLRAAYAEPIEAFRTGAPDEILLEEAATHHARLLVLAAARQRPGLRGPAGLAERVAETAHVPTLVVRDAAPLLRWARGERRLRIFAGVDFSQPSEATLAWLDWLRKAGPCELVVACLESTPASDPHAGLVPSLFLDEMVLKSAHLRERYLREHIRERFGTSRVRARFEKGWSHSDAHLLHLAAEERADLIVVGTHSRHGWQRLGHHSVSRGVMRYAPLNVVCVPAPADETPGRSPSVLQSLKP